MSQPPDRAAAILARFNAAHQSLIGKLRELPAALAEQSPSSDAWSAAQIGWHVATTNHWAAGVLLGSAPHVQPAPAGFRESFDPSKIPTRVKTIPQLEPPAIVRLDAALARLRASAQQLTKAIASLTPQRGTGYTVTLLYGTLSLFEFADFVVRHVARHDAQIDRIVANTAV
jgi:uncharacterized damage-inducible protein DinB